MNSTKQQLKYGKDSKYCVQYTLNVYVCDCKYLSSLFDLNMGYLSVRILYIYVERKKKHSRFSVLSTKDVKRTSTSDFKMIKFVHSYVCVCV